MTVSSLNYGLTVTNFRTDDECNLAYPFPILHGYVIHPDGESVREVIVRVLRRHAQNSESLIERFSDFQAVWPVKRRCFRGVVRLSVGLNAVTLTAQLELNGGFSQQLVLQLSLFYQPVQNPENFVLPVLICSHDSDGSIQAAMDEDGSLDSAVRRIATGAGLLQSATAELLAAEGFPKKTFHLALDENGWPRCEVFRSHLIRDELYAQRDEQLWRFLQAELRAAFPAYTSNCKFLAFLADTRYCLPDVQPVPYLYEDNLKFLRGNVALGGSSLALCGTGCLYTWPESVEDLPRRLADERSVDRRCFMDDSAYRGTRWACFSTTLGAACHELGHTFDLGHEPVGIMARGFDDIYTVFTATRPAVVGLPSVPEQDLPSTASSLKKLPTPQSIAVTRKEVPVSAPAEFKVVETSAGHFTRKREYLVTEMEPVTVQSKERTSLAAKMSGKFFSSKRKDFRNEEVVITHRRSSAVDSLSTMDPDSCSIPSSCAISLFEPESSCNVSTVSTRPSSIASAATKRRTLLKRFSLGSSDCEQFTQRTAVVDTSTLPAAVQPNGSSKAIITKHYKTVVVTSSSSGVPLGSLDGSRSPSGYTATDKGIYGSTNHINGLKNTSIKEERTTQEKSYKSPWSRLFSSKKKKDRLPEFSEVEAEERSSPSRPPTTVTDNATPTPHQPTFHAGITTADEIAAHTKRISTDPVIQRHHRSPPTLNGVISTSESEEPASPDSLEEYHFSFHDLPDRQPQYIATAISQDPLGEIRHVPAPPKNVSPPAVDGGADSSTTPEPDYLEASVQKARQAVEAGKPQPTRRERKSVAAVTGAGESDRASSPTRDIISTAGVVRKPRRAEDILRRVTREPEKVREVHFDVSQPVTAFDIHNGPVASVEDKGTPQRVVGKKVDRDGALQAVAGESAGKSTSTSRAKAKSMVARAVSAENLLDSPSRLKSAPKKEEKTALPSSQTTASADKPAAKAVRYSSAENLLDARQKPVVKKEETTKKQQPIIQSVESRNSSTPQAYRYPVDDAHLKRWKEQAEPSPIKVETAQSTEQKTTTQSRPRLDLRIAPPATRTKSNDQPRVMTGSLQTGSKLRFPLRNQATAPKSGNPKETDSATASGRNSVLNHFIIPTRSTLSSRNKENKPASAKPTEEKTKSLSGLPLRRKSFKRKSLGRGSSRKKRNGPKKDDSASNSGTLKKDKSASSSRAGSTLHLAVPSLRLDFKQINDAAHMHAYPAHQRSASRDSIGYMGPTPTAETDCHEVAGKDFEAPSDMVEENVNSAPVAAGGDNNRGTLNRKQHCSSLINTPSGISVMEEVTAPHRLPLPVAPPMVPIGDREVVGPQWTRNCAALLNCHKWFNPHIPTDPKTPPQLDGHTLSAAGGIRLIELRDVCGKVLHHWEYPGGSRGPAPTSVVLPLASCTDKAAGKAVVVAIDVYGNMIHRTVRGRFV